MEFKDRIKLLREDNNLSLTQLASSFEKSEAAVRAWELGRTKPDADTLIRLSIYFDCTIDYLLGLSDIKNKKMEIDFNNKIQNISLKFDKMPMAYTIKIFDMLDNIQNSYFVFLEINKYLKQQNIDYDTTKFYFYTIENKITAFQAVVNIFYKYLAEHGVSAEINSESDYFNICEELKHINSDFVVEMYLDFLTDVAKMIIFNTYEPTKESKNLYNDSYNLMNKFSENSKEIEKMSLKFRKLNILQEVLEKINKERYK